MSDIHQKIKNVTANLSILYVEDEQITREQYENIFKLLFREVVSVQNGKIALEEYDKKKYDLVITDLTMPEMDGVSLISEILNINPNQHTIIMTAHNTDENLRSSIDFQVDGILLKPVVMDKLFALLYKVCHQIYFEKKDLLSITKDKKLDKIINNNEKALFIVVIDRFYDIVSQFGNQTKDYIVSVVKEHLSNFGIENENIFQLHKEVLICNINKSYLDRLLEALQAFSDSHNTLVVKFNNLKIYITLSYGVIIFENINNNIDNSENYLTHVNSIVNDIKNDANSNLVVKMDIGLEETKKNDSLSWLGLTLDALNQETIVPFYQKILDINSMKTMSYEVFSRIKQGDKYIRPKFFIDLSKKAGILDDISKSIFNQSYKQLSSTEFSFHINLGNSELSNSAIGDYIIYLNKQYKIENNRVILNIENYELLKPSGRIVDSLLKLKKLGYKMALKGFADGNINIELLSVLKPNYIKINQVLLEKSLVDENMKFALSFLLDYTNKVGIKSILTEVENEEILNKSRELGFNYVQGYFIGKPSDKL